MFPKRLLFLDGIHNGSNTNTCIPAPNLGPDPDPDPAILKYVTPDTDTNLAYLYIFYILATIFSGANLKMCLKWRKDVKTICKFKKIIGKFPGPNFSAFCEIKHEFTRDFSGQPIPNSGR